MKTLAILPAAISLALMPVIASADSFKLDELTCFEVQSLSQDGSLFVIGMLVGHAMGNDDLSPEAIQAAVKAMDVTCGDNPNMAAIEALS